MKKSMCVSCNKEIKKDKRGVCDCVWVLGMRVCKKCFQRGERSTIGRRARPFMNFRVR